MSDQKSKSRNQLILLFIWVSSFTINSVSNFFSFVLHEISTGEIGSKALAGTTGYGIIATIIYTRIRGKLGDDAKVNAKNMKKAFISILILILISAFIGWANLQRKLDKHKKFRNDQAQSEANDLEKMIKSGFEGNNSGEIDISAIGEIDISAISEAMDDPDTNAGKIFKQIFSESAEILTKYQNDLKALNPLSAESVADLSNANRMIQIRKSLNAVCQLDKKYYEDFIITYKAVESSFGDVSIVVGEYLKELMVSSIVNAETLKGLNAEKCSAYEAWYSFIILNKDEIHVENDEIYIESDEIREQYNALSQAAESAQAVFDMYSSDLLTTSKANMESALNNMNN